MTHWVKSKDEEEMQVELMQKRSSEMSAQQEIELQTLDCKRMTHWVESKDEDEMQVELMQK